MAKASPSIRDVAHMAEVSHQTVSRYLNRPESLLPATRLRVERAISVLDWHPNPAARALKSRRSRAVGALVAGNSLFVATDGLAQLELSLRTLGLRMLMTGTHGESFAAMTEGVQPLLDFGVDALVIIANQQSAADLARQLARTLPVVAIQPGVSPDDGVSSVAVDFDAGIAAVVEHFIDRGSHAMVHVPGPQHLTTARARSDAWARELAARGLPVRHVAPVPMTTEGGYQAGVRLLTEGSPDAIFAVNDLCALGVIAALRTHSVRVPHDVAVAGMDDMMGSAFTSPSLTTLTQPFAEIGRQAATLVGQALAGEPPRTVRIHPQLIVRESTS